MHKIIIDKDNNVTTQVEIGLGQLGIKTDENIPMTFETDMMLQYTKDKLISILKKKKITQEDNEQFNNYMNEYVKYTLMDLVGIKSYPVVMDNGNLINVDDDIEVILE